MTILFNSALIVGGIIAFVHMITPRRFPFARWTMPELERFLTHIGYERVDHTPELHMKRLGILLEKLNSGEMRFRHSDYGSTELVVNICIIQVMCRHRSKQLHLRETSPSEKIDSDIHGDLHFGAKLCQETFEECAHRCIKERLGITDLRGSVLVGHSPHESNTHEGLMLPGINQVFMTARFEWRMPDELYRHTFTTIDPVKNARLMWHEIN